MKPLSIVVMQVRLNPLNAMDLEII